MKKNSRSFPGDLLILSRSHFSGVNLIPGVSRSSGHPVYVRKGMTISDYFYKVR